VEFADIECPFCGRFARDTYPQLKRDYIDAGRLRYAFRHFPLDAIHMKARRASIALECAGEQGGHQYWAMHTRLFQEPQQIGESALLQSARTLGLNGAQFSACLETEPAPIKRDIEEARRLGVRSTPTFFVARTQADGKWAAINRINGVLPYEALKSILKEVGE
jgi:protein-disulfide isomerase